MDYCLIELRRKYYSNSRNPRVIHTKLKDQRLTTLRTCPHDKYFVKPGEYLTIEEETEAYEELDSLVDFYLSSNQDLLVDLEDKKSVDEDEEDHKVPAELFSATSPATQLSTGSLDGDNLKASASTSKDQSGDLEAKTAPLKLRGNRQDMQRVWAKLHLGAIPNLMGKSASSSGTSEAVEGNKSSYNCPQCFHEGKVVWKTVFNDVSLSAARLSTGSDGTSKEDYENLSSDFIDSKRKGSDLFADTYVAGRAKFYGKP